MALREVPPDEVLSQFNETDGRALGLRLLRNALSRRDGVEVELALIVSFTFGFTPDHLQPLLELAPARWHKRHEDVVSALGDLQTPLAIDALVEATQWVPDYLDFDESRALATKALWALGRIPGDRAERALSRLARDADAIVSEGAKYQLKRRARRG